MRRNCRVDLQTCTLGIEHVVTYNTDVKDKTLFRNDIRLLAKIRIRDMNRVYV